MPQVSSAVLKWARESAGLGLEEAARRIGLGDARGISAAARLAALENGEGQPSRSLLVKMAKQYRRPLLVFYLPAPPKKGNRGQDFRSLSTEPSASEEGILDALIRDVLVRQGLVRAALEESDEAKPIPFVGSWQITRGVPTLVRAIRDSIGLTLEAFRSAPSPHDAFALLRTHTERTGVYVLLLGDLGSHHTALGVDVFRGFAAADPVAPFLVINDHDSRAAWSFTLVHELAHLWLGETGISGGLPGRAVEQYCNEVASEFLLPSAELRSVMVRPGDDVGALIQRIDDFASARNISRSMVAYRLHRAEVLGPEQWHAVSQAFRQAWLEQRERQREKAREREGGPNYYVVRRHRVGDALLATTARLLRDGVITTAKAARILNVKPNNVQTILGSSTLSSRAS